MNKTDFSTSLRNEMGVIASIIMDNARIHKVVGLLADDDFKDGKNRVVYKACKKLILDNKQPADLVTIRDYFRENEIISPVYLTRILDATPTAGHINYYIAQVKQYATELKLWSFFACAGKQAQEKDGNFKNYLTKLEAQLRDITDYYRGNGIDNEIEPEIYIPKELRRYEDYKKDPDPCRGIKTGFPIFDRITKGLKRLNVFLGTTSVGKSALVANIAGHIALMEGLPVLYVNYEMNQEDLIRRMISSLSEVPSDCILDGRYNPGEYQKVVDMGNLIKEIGTLFITDRKPRTINDTLSLIYEYKNKNNIRVVIIDYLGEIADDETAAKERKEYITYGRYTQALKDIGSELDICCLLIVQFNRHGENDPSRANIGGSWKIMQKADIGAALYFEKKDKEYILEVQKQRHGKCPYKIILNFRKEIHKFTESGF